jgi:hypothetical protein
MIAFFSCQDKESRDDSSDKQEKEGIKRKGKILNNDAYISL